MPKRPNPWMDDAPFLLKTHISTKELSAGVDGENYASMMLDHTRQLMLDGAKNYYSNPLGECMEISKTAISQPVCYENSQRTITDFFNKSCKNLLGKQLKPNKTSKLCCHSSHDAKCSFCDIPLCQACVNVCSVCQNMFCSDCSMLSYEHSFTTSICLSCKR